MVVPAGSIKVGPEYIRISPSGTYSSVESIENLQIRDPQSDTVIYLKDIATVVRETILIPQARFYILMEPQPYQWGFLLLKGAMLSSWARRLISALINSKGCYRSGWNIQVINFPGNRCHPVNQSICD